MYIIKKCYMPSPRMDGMSSMESRRKNSQAEAVRRMDFEPGSCKVCGKTPIVVGPRGGTTVCGSCLKSNAKNARKMYKRRKAAGVCVQCAAEPKTGRILCKDCHDAKIVAQRARRQAARQSK